MTRDRTVDLAIVGAYIAEGLFSHRTKLLEHCPCGHIGIVADACSYAEYALDLCDAGYGVTGEYPGVWEYEVIDPFGSWYAKRLIATDHQQPTPQQVRVYLLNETQAFFTLDRRIGTEDDFNRLGEALLNVPFLDGR